MVSAGLMQVRISTHQKIKIVRLLLVFVMVTTNASYWDHGWGCAFRMLQS